VPAAACLAATRQALNRLAGSLLFNVKTPGPPSGNSGAATATARKVMGISFYLGPAARAFAPATVHWTVVGAPLGSGARFLPAPLLVHFDTGSPEGPRPSGCRPPSAISAAAPVSSIPCVRRAICGPRCSAGRAGVDFHQPGFVVGHPGLRLRDRVAHRCWRLI
jgi:hypothetical protein